MLAALRGATDAAQAHLAEIGAWRHSESDQLRWTHVACEAVVALAGGDASAAFGLVSGTMREVIAGEGPAGQASRIGFPCALEAALELGRAGEAGDLLGLLAERPPGQVPPFLRAQVERGRGLLALEAGDRAAAGDHFTAAIAMLSALEYPYWLARVRTDLGALLLDEWRTQEARGTLEEAVAALGVLRAAPALRRAEAVLARLPLAAG